MTRLQLERNRLHGTDGDTAHAPGPRGTRVLVMALSPPAGWEQLSRVWKGVQSDLDLPAPAIAVSGGDALQLWFFLAQPIAEGDGDRFLQGLRGRYLADTAPRHVRLLAEPTALPALPPVEVDADRWSAFVTPDLAPVFADTPWLDVAPGEDGQATLLRAIEPIGQGAFEAALVQLEASGREDDRRAAAAPPAIAAPADPERFLVGVMNDEAVELALRIEAAKALLQARRG